MSDYKLAIAIGGKLDASLSSAVKEAQGMLDGLNGGKGGGMLSKAFSGIGDVVSGIGKASMASLGAISSAMVAAGTASVNTGMEFEDAMADLAGTAGITRSSEAFAEYQEAAREVGATTNKTATEAAQALKYMALAGWDTQSSIQALDDMVKLSSASGTDLARTSDLVTDSMGALGLTMEDYGGYMDLVARADSAANYSSAELMETMIGAGGSARMLGIDLTELSTAAGILANNGTKGSEAGTALNGMFTRLAKQSKPVADSLSELGVSITDNEGNFLSFHDMLGNIKEGLANVASEEDRARIAATLFGTNYQSEAQYLMEALGEGGGWDALQQNLENAKNGVDEFGNAFDTLEERYKTATDTLTGDLDVLKSTISDFGIEIYQSLVGGEGTGIRGAVQEATTIVNELKEAFKTDGLDGLATGIGDALGKVADEIGSKGAEAIDAAASFAENLVKSIGDNGDSIGGAAAEIVTSLGNAFLTYTDDFVIAGGNLIKGLMDGLVAEGTADQWATGLTEMIGNIGSWFEENGEALGATAGTLVTQLAMGLSEHAGDIISGGISIVGGLAKGILAGLPTLVAQIPNMLRNVVNGIIDCVPQFLETGKELGKALMDGLAEIAEGWAGTASELELGGMFGVDDSTTQAMIDNAGAMQDAIAEIWANADTSEMTQGVQNYIDRLVQGKMTVEELGATIAATRGYGDTTEMDAAMTAYTQMMDQAAETLTATQEAASEAVEAVSTTTEEQAETAAQSIEELQTTVTEQYEALAESMTTTGEAASEMASSMDPDALSAVVEAIDTGQIDQMTASFTTAMETFTTTANATSTAVQADFNAMSTSATMTATMIYNVFASIDLSGVASQMMAGLTSGIQAGGAAAIAEAESIANKIAETMRAALQIKSPSRIMMGIGGYIGQGLAIGMQDTERDVTDAAGGLAGASINGMMQDAEAGSVMASGGGVTFSPQITIQGSASESDVRNALAWGMEQFRTMYQRMIADDRRAAYV